MEIIEIMGVFSSFEVIKAITLLASLVAPCYKVLTPFREQNLKLPRQPSLIVQCSQPTLKRCRSFRGELAEKTKTWPEL